MTYGIVSFNKWCNFVNYGSILQTYALQQTLNKIGIDNTVVEYIPDSHLDSDLNNPLKKMQDSRVLSRLNCRLSYPAIRRTNIKFDAFWDKYIRHTPVTYRAANCNELSFDGYICGADTIWCKDEFGFDDGFFANYPSMIDKHNIAFSASLSDTPFSEDDTEVLSILLGNFKAIGVREDTSIELIRSISKADVRCTIDPTLLLDNTDYDTLLPDMSENRKYLLLYTRAYNPEMIAFAEKTAKERKLKIIDISLRILDSYKHDVRYDTGIDEFLWLCKNCECIVTNSYHGLIFAMQYRKEFCIYTRNQTSLKTNFLLSRIGLPDALSVAGNEPKMIFPDYGQIWAHINKLRDDSVSYLKCSLYKGT